MSKELTKEPKASEVEVTNNEYGVAPALWSALTHIIYPGASHKTVKVIVDYCVARDFDPLQKPYHVVAYSGREQILPSISMYRIQASRSGQHIGTSEPDFGPDETSVLGGKTVVHPKWCKVYIKKMVNGTVAEFTGFAIWKESYATASRDSLAPNTMWSKRVYSQLAKCAEADGLRRAFPDHVSQDPTIEEMEGKEPVDMKNVTPTTHTSKAAALSDKLSAMVDDTPTAPAPSVAMDTSDDVEPVDFEVAVKTNKVFVALKGLIDKHFVSAETQAKWCGAAGVMELEELPLDNMEKCVEWIKDKYENIPQYDLETGEIKDGTQ